MSFNKKELRNNYSKNELIEIIFKTQEEFNKNKNIILIKGYIQGRWPKSYKASNKQYKKYWEIANKELELNYIDRANYKNK